MTQTQMSELFGKERSNITKHIYNIINEGGLKKILIGKKRVKAHENISRLASLAKELPRTKS